MIPEYHLINIWFHNRLPLLTSDQPHLNYLCDCTGIRTHNQSNQLFTLIILIVTMLLNYIIPHIYHMISLRERKKFSKT